MTDIHLGAIPFEQAAAKRPHIAPLGVRERDLPCRHLVVVGHGRRHGNNNRVQLNTGDCNARNAASVAGSSANSCSGQGCQRCKETGG
eukprot:31283-Rhodomonas_salina.2